MSLRRLIRLSGRLSDLVERRVPIIPIDLAAQDRATLATGSLEQHTIAWLALRHRHDHWVLDPGCLLIGEQLCKRRLTLRRRRVRVEVKLEILCRRGDPNGTPGRLAKFGRQAVYGTRRSRPNFWRQIGARKACRRLRYTVRVFGRVPSIGRW
jgi:hypothetical protein